jgi:hypothetical protein
MNMGMTLGGLYIPPLLATKTSTSHLTTGNLFTYTGTIGIVSITGRITTAIEASANTCKLSIVSDALAAYDMCTTKDLNALGAGTLLSITGTANGAMVATTLVASLAPGQANMIVVTCVTSGVITVTYGTAAKDGVIVWNVYAVPLSVGATLVAA